MLTREAELEDKAFNSSLEVAYRLLRPSEKDWEGGVLIFCDSMMKVCMLLVDWLSACYAWRLATSSSEMELTFYFTSVNPKCLYTGMFPLYNYLLVLYSWSFSILIILVFPFPWSLKWIFWAELEYGAYKP